jgi:hypothetical protein
MAKSRRITELNRRIANTHGHVNNGIRALSSREQYLTLLSEGPTEIERDSAELAEMAAGCTKEAREIQQNVKVAAELEIVWQVAVAKMQTECAAKGQAPACWGVLVRAYEDQVQVTAADDEMATT